MESKCSHSSDVAVNLKQLPPTPIVNSSVKGKLNNSSTRAAAAAKVVEDDASSIEGMKKGSARSKLYEICAANHWKRPLFECCKEEGPSHHTMFAFKVVIETASKNIIECYGAPHQKKKMAADHAAEGALWYLKKIGFVIKKKK